MEEIIKKLKRCKNCTRNGNPRLMRDSDGDWYYFVDCEQCTDDAVFFCSEAEAMQAYRDKYAKGKGE